VNTAIKIQEAKFKNITKFNNKHYQTVQREQCGWLFGWCLMALSAQIKLYQY